VLAEGGVSNYDLTLGTKDGREIPVSYNATVLRDPAGRITGVLGSARDMTELKEAEKELRGAGAYNRSLIEASLDLLVTIDPDGKITDANSPTAEATGCSREELIGMAERSGWNRRSERDQRSFSPFQVKKMKNEE